MSDNEIDQIRQELGAVFRHAMTAARQYIASQRNRGPQPRKLTRAQRREMAEHIRTQVGEQRIAAAWFTKRVQDYQHEHAAMSHLLAQAGPDEPQATTAAYERLHAMRYSIESTLHNTALQLEHRGQVVQALDRINRDPHTRIDTVFAPLTAETALSAREAAVSSERWVADRRAYTEQVIAQQRAAQQERRSDPVSLRAENDALRQRLAQLEAEKYGPEPEDWAGEREPVHRAAAGTASEQSPRGPGAEHAIGDDQLTEAQFNAIQGVRHTQAQLREALKDGRGVTASRINARAAATTAARKVGEQRAAWEVEHAEANSRAVVTISSALNGKASQNVSYFPAEAEAARWANSQVMETNWKPGVTIAVRGYEAGQAAPFYITEGNQAAVGRDTGLWASETRDGFGHTTESTEQLRAQHRLSVEHNTALSEKNADLAAQLRKVTAERDQLAEQNRNLVGDKAAERTNGHNPTDYDAFASASANGFATAGGANHKRGMHR